jgi:hypothetical protein
MTSTPKPGLQRVTHRVRVNRRERRRNMGILTIFGVEIAGGIESRCPGHHVILAITPPTSISSISTSLPRYFQCAVR